MPILEKGRIYYRLIAGEKFAAQYEFISYTHTLNGRAYGFKCSPLGTRTPNAPTAALPSQIVGELRPATSEVLKQFAAETEAARVYRIIKRVAREMAFIAENAEVAAYEKNVGREIESMQLALHMALQETHAALPQTRPVRKKEAPPTDI